MPKHHCDAGDFSRMVCPEPCGTMHSYCSTCGSLQDECPNAGLALIPPQRCAPGEDEVAEALHADACPVIAAAALKPIRELHREQFQFCRDCDADYPCPTIRLLDEIEAAAKGGDEQHG